MDPASLSNNNNHHHHGSISTENATPPTHPMRHLFSQIIGYMHEIRDWGSLGRMMMMTGQSDSDDNGNHNNGRDSNNGDMNGTIGITTATSDAETTTRRDTNSSLSHKETESNTESSSEDATGHDDDSNATSQNSTISQHFTTLATFLSHHIQYLRHLLSQCLQIYHQYGRKYQRSILLSLFLLVMGYKYLKRLARHEVAIRRRGGAMRHPTRNHKRHLSSSGASSSKYSPIALDKRTPRLLKDGTFGPYSLGALDWQSEALLSSSRKTTASLHHRSRVRIGSEAFLRKYPNEWLNFLAKIFILVRYRWIEWIRRIEWWFVGGWGLMTSVAMFNGAYSNTSNRSASEQNSLRGLPPQAMDPFSSMTSQEQEQAESTKGQDPRVATLVKLKPKEDEKQKDEVLGMLDEHFEKKMRSAPWMQKMDNFLRGDDQVMVGGGVGAYQTPMMGASQSSAMMRRGPYQSSMGGPQRQQYGTSQYQQNPGHGYGGAGMGAHFTPHGTGSSHLGNFRMRRMR